MVDAKAWIAKTDEFFERDAIWSSEDYRHTMVNERAVQRSIAISLKRIADMMEADRATKGVNRAKALVPVTPMSTCNKCGAKFPSAPVGTIHKCGSCSGGMMVRDGGSNV